MANKMDRRFFRDHFPALRTGVYLNTGSEGLIPRETYKNVNRLITKNFKYGGSHPKFYDMVNHNLNLLPEFIRKLDINPDDQIRVSSISEGLNFSLNMLSHNNINSILIRKDEFKTGILAAYAFCKKNGAKIIWAENIEDFILKLSTDRPDIALISHVDYRDGRECDLKKIYEICLENDAFLIVDGAQSVGNLFFRFPEKLYADLYVWTTHKWLCSPRGLGFINVSERIRSSLGPQGYQYFSTKEFDPPNVEVLDELSSMSVHPANFIGEIGFVSTLRFLETKVGFESIISRNRKNKDYFLKKADDERLEVKPSDTNLISIKVKRPEEIVERMYKRRILFRMIPHTDYIRVSIHFYNTGRDIDIFFKKLEDVMGGL